MLGSISCRLSILVALILAASCTSDRAEVQKPNGKMDSSEKLCRQAGEPDDCDVCEVQGWYGDGECDDFCATRDPDCPADPFADREPNPACDPRLDDWMFRCIEHNVTDNGETLADAIDFCIGAAEDTDPLAVAGYCWDEALDEEDVDCLMELSDNAMECGTAIGQEFRQPNPACDPRLDPWMFSCVGGNLADGDSPEDAASFCVDGVLDGDPLGEEGVCDSDDEDCMIEVTDNAEDCAAAIVSEITGGD